VQIEEGQKNYKKMSDKEFNAEMDRLGIYPGNA